jgi:hypothetical protein
MTRVGQTRASPDVAPVPLCFCPTLAIPGARRSRARIPFVFTALLALPV